jgi:hypothetical protein
VSRSFRERVPWWAKLGAKVVLSRLPFSYRRWRSVGNFRHGRMLDPAYAREVFERHFRHVRGSVRPGFALLELGPGEASLFARSGFYTNRLRASEIAEIFSAAGFRIRNVLADRWPPPPLPRARLHPEFARFDDDELRVHGIDLVAEKPA